MKTDRFYSKNQTEFNKLIKQFESDYDFSKYPMEHNYQFGVLKKEYRFGKCNYCNSIIDICGIQSHGRVCENCGEIIHRDYWDGSIIRFYMRDKNEQTDGSLEITLQLKKPPVDRDGEFEFDLISIPIDYYNNVQDKGVVINQLKKHNGLIIYNTETDIAESVILNKNQMNICETTTDRKYRIPENHSSVVKIWDGVEYSEFDDFPVNETITIYKDWLIKKDAKEILRRSGMSSRPEFYSGRGVKKCDLNSKHLIKIFDLIYQQLKEDAAFNFCRMLFDIDQLSATAFIRNFLALERSNWKWPTKVNKEKKINSDIELDGTEMNAFATLASKLYGGGDNEFLSFRIKNEFFVYVNKFLNKRINKSQRKASPFYTTISKAIENVYLTEYAEANNYIEIHKNFILNHL